MATRTSSPPRKRPSGSQARKKPAAKRKPAQKRKPVKRRPARSGPGPLTVLFNGIFGLLRAIWLGVAGAVGAVARSIGHSAGDLEPEQRRDGVGFAVLGLAIVVAASVWWQIPGIVGEAIRNACTGSVGLLAWAVPILLDRRRLAHPPSSRPQRPCRAPGHRLGRHLRRRARARSPVARRPAPQRHVRRPRGRGSDRVPVLGDPRRPPEERRMSSRPFWCWWSCSACWSSPEPRCTRCPSASAPSATRRSAATTEEEPGTERRERKRHPRTSPTNEPFENPLVDGPDEDRKVPVTKPTVDERRR